MGRWPLLLALLGAPLTAPAQAPAPDIDYGSIDGYVVPQADASWPPGLALGDSGDGFGARVLSRATEQVMVLGEYQRLAYDDGTTQQFRIGAGLAQASTTGFFLTLDRLDLDRENATALGLHGRVAGTVAGPVSLYGQLGYLAVDARSFYYDGVEFTLGLTYDLREPWGLFADYRATLLDDHDRIDKLHRDELRVGVRFRFDC